MSLPFRRAVHVLLPLGLIVALLGPAGASAAAPTPQSSLGPTINGWTGNLGDTLTCQSPGWSDSPHTVTQRWTRDGETMTTEPTYTLTMGDIRRTVRCVETATNGDGTVVSESQIGVYLTEQMPVVVTDPTVTGTAIVGRPLSCDGAAFSGIHLGEPTFEWVRVGGGSGAIGTGQVYRPVKADVGYDIGCRASVSNPTGSTEAHSRHVSVESGLPNVDTIPKVVGKAQPSFTVTCTPGTWSGDGITFSYQWLLQGKPIKGATKPTIMVIDAWDEKELACRVTATNANGAVPFDSHVASVFTPPVKARFAKVQPKLPKLGAAISKGVSAKLVCNVTCATEATAMMLLTDAQRLGIASKRDRGIGGFFIVGQTYATRTFAGELLVTTKFSAKAKRGLAKAKSVRVDYVYMTSNGTKYSFKKYHVANTRSITLKR